MGLNPSHHFTFDFEKELRIRNAYFWGKAECNRNEIAACEDLRTFIV